MDRQESNDSELYRVKTHWTTVDEERTPFMKRSNYGSISYNAGRSSGHGEGKPRPWVKYISGLIFLSGFLVFVFGLLRDPAKVKPPPMVSDESTATEENSKTWQNFLEGSTDAASTKSTSDDAAQTKDSSSLSGVASWIPAGKSWDHYLTAPPAQPHPGQSAGSPAPGGPTANSDGTPTHAPEDWTKYLHPGGGKPDWEKWTHPAGASSPIPEQKCGRGVKTSVVNNKTVTEPIYPKKLDCCIQVMCGKEMSGGMSSKNLNETMDMSATLQCADLQKGNQTAINACFKNANETSSHNLQRCLECNKCIAPSGPLNCTGDFTPGNTGVGGFGR